MKTWRIFSSFTLLAVLFNTACAQQAKTPVAAASSKAVAPVPVPIKAPFPYVWGTAYHILPETHSDESGYFSIIEGNDGKIYVGTAKYNINGYLVEFDPKTETQKIVIDTNKVNNLTATGFAAQSKIHTRNFVGPSGTVYVGSQEGYRTIPGDTSVYPGGYVMAYDPKTGLARSLGMPMTGEGVLDVVADEARGLLYVVTSWGDDKKAHWMLGDITGKNWRELGPLPTDYSSTLMDKDGRAHVITADSRLATYDPQTKTVSIRDIEIKGQKWTRDENGIPTWQLTPDHKSAYLILMDDSTLMRLELGGNGPAKLKALGRMIEGTGYDSRSSLTVAPDGRVYALVKVNNETKFGDGYLHHLTRYDPKKNKTEDLGVLAVKNPEFFDFGPRPDGTNPPWSHGYHTLPDGTLTPLHGHQGLIAARDGSLYALILYPYTLLHIPAESVGIQPAAARGKHPVANLTAATGSYAHQYNAFALRAADQVEKNLPEIVRVAEIVAERHLKGGMIGFPWNSQGLQQELVGRSGGMVHVGFDRPWTQEPRTKEQDAQNVAIVGWDRAPGNGELDALKKLHEAGTMIIGFGPRGLPALAEHIKLCDEFFDTGLGADDRIVQLSNGVRAGRGNLLVNMLNGWTLTGEIVAALTRKGKMPTMWKGWLYPDGRAWSDKYFGKMQFHTDYQIAPIAARYVSHAFLREIRANIRRFDTTQSAGVLRAATLITEESRTGRKTIVATQGHAPWTYVGFYEDAQWGTAYDVDGSAPQQMEAYAKSPDGALVLRLGYTGLDVQVAKAFADKKQRIILITTPTPRPEYQPPAGISPIIDMGWEYGDAVVPIPGYPIKILPPSGIMQIVAYEDINIETLARLPHPKMP